MAFALLGEEEEAYEELQNEVPNLIVEELEKIKAEFEDRILLNQTVAIQIMDKHISELKGEKRP